MKFFNKLIKRLRKEDRIIGYNPPPKKEWRPEKPTPPPPPKIYLRG